MPPEPNEKIDDLLKRYVEQRKAESRADFELHPATRNLLQGEVTRTFAKTEGARKKPILILWPRLAIVGAFTAALVVTLMVLNSPKQRGIELAQSSSKERAVVSAAREVVEPTKPLLDAVSGRSDLTKPETPLPAAEPPSKRLAGELEIAASGGVAAIETRSEAKLSEPSDQLAPAKRKTESSLDETAAAKVVTADTFARTANDFAVLETEVTSSFNSNVPAAPAVTSLYSDVASQNRWQFLQHDLRAKYRQNLLSPAQPKILQSFELIRNGDKIRLVDRDGSIYEGEILAAGQSNFGEKDARDKNEKSSAFAFRVAGTNQKLNRIVSVTGEFLTANADAEGKNLERKADTIQLGALKKQSLPAQGGVIQGKVSIGGTNEFEIRATTDLPK